MSDSLFRKESLDALSSPEKLDDYIHVTRFSWYLALAALLLIVVTACIWASIGTIPENTNVSALIADEQTLICYVPTSVTNQDLRGKSAQVRFQGNNAKSYLGSITDMKETPVSQQEAREDIESDWAYQELIKAPFSYEVTIRLDEPIRDSIKGSICSVIITTDEVKPIVYFLNLTK